MIDGNDKNAAVNQLFKNTALLFNAVTSSKAVSYFKPVNLRTFRCFFHAANNFVKKAFPSDDITTLVIGLCFLAARGFTGRVSRLAISIIAVLAAGIIFPLSFRALSTATRDTPQSSAVFFFVTINALFTF